MKPKHRSITSIEVAEESIVAQAQSLIYRAMRGAKLSQTALARRLKVTPARVSQMLGDDRNPTLRTLVRALDTCGYSLKMSLRKP